MRQAMRCGRGSWDRIGVMLAMVVMASGCGEPPPPPPPPQAAAPPPPRPITLDAIQELVVRAGTSGTARIEVNRAGHAGEATVSLSQPSDPGLTATADPIAADSRTGAVVVTAADSLGLAETVASLQVTVTLDGMTAQENLSVRVPQFEAPTFEPREPVVLQPGRSGTAVVRIDRRDSPPRPIELRVRGGSADGQPAAAPPPDAPSDIACTPLTIAADDDAATIELAVAPGVAEGTRTLVLSGSTMEREFPVELTVTVLGRPYGLSLSRAVTIAPGERIELPLAVSRAAHAGAISGVVENLPPGVTAERVVIEPAAEAATVVVKAALEAEPRVRSAVLRTTGGPFAIDEPLVVRVQRPGEAAVLPPAVMQGGDGPRPRKPGPLAGRVTPAVKRALADLHGGTADSEAAVARGLSWLSTVQQADGSWTLKGGDAPAGGDAPSDPDPPADPTLATALAVLPFLGEGVSHQRAPSEPVQYESYKAVVEKGLVFLCMNQVRERSKADGFLKGSIESHAVATLALAEDYALSRDDRLKLHIRQAVKFLGAAQNQDGSWALQPGGAGDLSTTCWAVQALRAVQAAGLGASSRQFTKARQFVEACAAGPADAPRSRYRSAGRLDVSPLGTAAALLTQARLPGNGLDEADLQAASRFLLETMPASAGVAPMPYLFFATEAMRASGGIEFDAWNHATRDHLVKRQRQDGDGAGSWDPDGEDGGRMEATSLALLTLEVYYRNLPTDRGTGQASTSDGADDEPADAARESR